MEVDDIQGQGCKFPRIGNGGRSNLNNNKVGNKGTGVFPDDEEDGEVKRGGLGGLTGGSLVDGGGVGRLCGWPSSRIVRVSRASGGKDRHSKVLTSKGLRDRRVRLSVGTAIQFYDLQDRLGYDQPSKAVEWLLKAAAKSIDELPSITTPFPETTNLLSNQLSDDKRSSPGTEHGFDCAADLELDGDLNYQQQHNHHHNHNHHHASLSKSACSSTSETSKGSGLSLSRSESRIKARERAKERMAEKEKEKDGETRTLNPISQSSFTELLTGGINNVNRGTNGQNGSAQRNVVGVSEANLFPKPRQWSSSAMDYFSSGLLPPSPSRNHNSSGFSGHHNLGNSPMSISSYNAAASGDPHQELQFSFVQDHLMPVASAAGSGGGGHNDYNLNFTISSGLAGLNRGTLQSNSPSLMSPHVQRLSSIDGSNAPFFIGTASPNAAPVENHHHQFPAGLDGRLQLYYGDCHRHSDQKGKGKN